MPDEPRIDDWLDRWEGLRERGFALAPEEFLAGFRGEIPPPLAGEFVRRARALERMDRRMGQAEASSGSASRSDGESLELGREPVPGYVLVERLGRGGFGEVWKARGPGGFHLALKFVPLGHRAGAAELRALDVIREIRHPHLLATVGSWQAGGRLVIAMELAERSLLDRLREAVAQGGPGIPGAELAEYMLEVAKGIDYLNEPRHPAGGKEPLGIQHRDIKPQNLLLVGGSVKVADFGLARLLEHAVTGHTGSMTPAYAAPEFFRLETSAHSDQYSLAVTYCHLRGGRLPFAGSPVEIMGGHVGRAPDLAMLPAAERPAVARALAKAPGDRWPSCRAFVAALEAARTGTEAPAPGDALTPRARRASGGRRLAAALGLVALLAVAAVVARSRRDGRDAPPPADAPGGPGPQASPPLADREPAAPAPRPAGVPPASPGPAGDDPGAGTREVAATTGRAAEPSPPPASGDLATAHLIRGRLLWDRRDLDAAIAELSAAIRLDPRLAAAYYFRGCCHAARLDQDRAIADYDEVERLEPGRVGNRYMRGWAYMAKGQHRRAIADLDEAIRLEPRNAGAYLRRSTAHSRLGDRARAEADRRRALQLDPGVEERVLRGRGGTGSSPR